jgi:16S rRNA (cytosine967-C5)-methyltransferase
MAVRVESPATADELSDTGIELAAGELLTAARTVVSGDVTATEAFREGRVRLQDEGSQLIGELAAGITAGLVQNREKILDACAAPGGKTLILAERNPNALIVACESSPRRLADLSKRLAAYADRVECRLADAAGLEEEGAFDLALVDVPCSGTGTLGRNPEIRHRFQLEDLPRLAERQRDILRGALRAVRLGGRVVYSTCSLEPEENEQVVTAALSENPNVRQISLAPAIEALERNGILRPKGAERMQQCLTPEGALRLLPGTLPTDGFFVALLERLA